MEPILSSHEYTKMEPLSDRKMENMNWLNDTIEGRINKYLMEIEEKYGVPNTEEKQMTFLTFVILKTGLKEKLF